MILFALVGSGCPNGNDSKTTGKITITGIPSSVAYVIVEAKEAAGAAVVGGNLNSSGSGTPVSWTAIENGSATLELYAKTELAEYINAARKGQTLPAMPEKKEIDGSGTILLRYAFINATSEQRKSWGQALRLKFNEDLTIKWTDGKDI
jgi:hypothetical protein